MKKKIVITIPASHVVFASTISDLPLETFKCWPYIIVYVHSKLGFNVK